MSKLIGEEFKKIIAVNDKWYMIITNDKYGTSITTCTRDQKRLDQVWVCFDKDTGNIIIER